MATVHLPTPLRPHAGGAASVQVRARTVGEALDSLIAGHPALKKHLFDESGKLRSFVNVYKNDEDVRYLQREATPVSERDSLSIIPSIAGGAAAPAPPASEAEECALSNEEIRRYS